MIYRCEFEFKGRLLTARSEEGIVAFSDGFWIDSNWNYTKAADCRYWIPPHRIEYIAKDKP